MAQLAEFGAMYYNTKKVKDMSDLICPPYDMITADEKEALIEKDPYNFVNLVLPDGEGEEKYRNAMNKIFSWLLRDVLIIDGEPGFYVYETEFNFDGNTLIRRGFIGLLKIEEYGEVVKKHEKTFTAYVEDRHLLLNETNTELESVFFVYKDKEKQLNNLYDKVIASSEKPMLEVVDGEGHKHRIYKISDAEINGNIKTCFADKSVYIADGHHRYETALKYRNSRKQELGEKYTGKEPFNYTIGAFFNVYDETIKILPTHRLIKQTSLSGLEILRKVEKHYKIAAMEFSDYRMEKAARIKLRKLLAEYKRNGQKAIGLYHRDFPNKYLLLVLKSELDEALGGKQLSEAMKELDVVLLESSILNPIFGISSENTAKQLYYIRGDAKALDLVKAGKCAIAFILNPVDPINVVNIAEKNEEMPHKSTDFYPKVVSGLLEYSFKYSKIKV
jgi:uncharacterized protein (DUF1015 family)